MIRCQYCDYRCDLSHCAQCERALVCAKHKHDEDAFYALRYADIGKFTPASTADELISVLGFRVQEGAELP